MIAPEISIINIFPLLSEMLIKVNAVNEYKRNVIN